MIKIYQQCISVKLAECQLRPCRDSCPGQCAA